jgi:hypothetical protein
MNPHFKKMFMKKIFLLLFVFISVSLFAEVGGGKKIKCVCLGDPSMNDGRCVNYPASHATRTGAYCAHTATSNYDCYATQCESGNAS